MYEIPNISGLDRLKRCRICFLKSSAVHPASYDEIIAFQNILQKVPTESDNILLCNYCGYTIQKYYKLYRQCMYSEYILSTFSKEELEGYIPNGPQYMRLAISTPGEEAVSTTPTRVKTELSDDDTDDTPLALLNNDDQDSVKEDSLKSETQETPDVKALPLLPKQRKREKRDKRRDEKRDKRRDKPLKKGFSSRMVQETDEYVVIKLSKEEVLEELRKRRESEQYTRAPHRCEPCAKGFNFHDVLLNHMKKHSADNGSILCDICQQYCPGAVSMRGHMKSHNTRYECKSCRLVSSSRQHLLQHHAALHAPAAAAYRCRRCDFRTNRHDAASCPRCEVCSRRFVYRSLLARHVRAAHGGRDHYCVECDARFKSADNLKSHFKKAKAHRDTSTYRVPCAQCPETFPSRAAAAAHAAATHGAAAHRCPVCQKEYTCRDSVRSHVRRVHGAGGAGGVGGAARGKHQCDVCQGVFTERSSLTRHMLTHARPRARAQKGVSKEELEPAISVQDL